MSWRRLVANLLLLAGVLIACILLAEIGLRVAGFEQPRLLPASIRASYRVEPGAAFEYRGFLPGTFEDFSNRVVLNALGFHERDYPVARPAPDTHRVLVLGDSYVAAFEVPLAETFHERIEQQVAERDPLGVGSYQWIAFGRGNRAQEAQLEWLRRQGPRYAPDAVLLVFFAGNDVMENSPVLLDRARRFGDRYMREVLPRKVSFFESVNRLPFSRINGLVAEISTGWYAANLHRFLDDVDESQLTSPELGIYEDPPPAAWRTAWERTFELFDAIRDQSTQLGSRLVVAGLSGPQAVGDVGLARLWSGESGVDWGAPLARVERWSSDARVPFVDLTPALRAAGGRNVYWRHDAHLTPRGHEVVEETLYEFLYGERGALR